MTNKERRTKGKERSYPILGATTLSALNRFIEHHGMAEAARQIGVSYSSLYRALQPGQRMRPSTIDAIRERVTQGRTARANGKPADGSTITIAIDVTLNAADTFALMQECVANGCQPGECLARLAVEALRSE